MGWSVLYDYNVGILGGKVSGYTSSSRLLINTGYTYVPYNIYEVSESSYNAGGYDRTYDTLWKHNVNSWGDLNYLVYPNIIISNNNIQLANLFTSCTDFTNYATTYGFVTGSSTYYGSAVIPSPTPTPTPTPANPTSVAGLQGWYDANNPVQFQPTIPTNGQLLTQWGDSSGLLHNLNSSGNPEKPTYYTNIQNGKPAVYYNGSANSQSATNYTGFQSATGMTIFVVAKISGTTGTQKITTMGDNKNIFDDALLGFSGATARYQVGAAGASAQDSAGVVDTTAHIHTTVFNGTLTGNANRLVYRRDRTPITLTFTGTVGATLNANSNILYVSQSAFPYNGFAMEIAVYNRTLTATEITNIENYLFAKWGTP